MAVTDDNRATVTLRALERLGSSTLREHDLDTQDARAMADNLQIALRSRAVIDQAMAILMERFTITADAAFRASPGRRCRTTRSSGDRRAPGHHR